MSRSKRSAKPLAAARVSSFAPLIGPEARILILGSMPGVASLGAAQYYAHPHNAFWKLMGAICGAGPELPYAERVAAFLQQRLALWDVLASCVRSGSLDAAIEHHSALPNDLPALLGEHPDIERICCNGGTAQRLLQRFWGGRLAAQWPQIRLIALPSSSPANASWSYARKLNAWSQALAASALSCA